jgi:uncharacterized protein YhbP (UPF0306 family)
VSARRREILSRFLESETTLALATAAADGAAQIAPLFYFPAAGPRLYWFSAASSAHSRNLARNPRASAAVCCRAPGWKQIRGVQMSGSVRIVEDAAERREITRGYCRRFRLGTLFAARIARSTLYCFQPGWCRYLDNTKRFGYKFELTLNPGDFPTQVCTASVDHSPRRPKEAPSEEFELE